MHYGHDRRVLFLVGQCDKIGRPIGDIGVNLRASLLELHLALIGSINLWREKGIL